MPVHGGKLAARALKEAGVEVVFTLSGGHIMPLYDGCIDEGIRIVDVRHEQAAVHAADAWARCRPGSIGVAAITAGPGVTDGVTGIANAWRANSPILVFGGQGPFENLRRGSLQEMDHLGVVRPITKYCDAVYQTKRIIFQQMLHLLKCANIHLNSYGAFFTIGNKCLLYIKHISIFLKEKILLS
jgi:acetolactate synthase-1/2/3 large subunit